MHTVFMMNESRGNLFIPPDSFVENVYRMVNPDRIESVSKDTIREVVNQKVKKGSIKFFGGMLYTKRAYEAEEDTAEALVPFIQDNGGKDVTDLIKGFEKKLNVELSPKQKEAVVHAVSYTHLTLPTICSV